MVRSEPKSMDAVISAYIKEMKLAAGLNEHRIYEAWDQVTGAGRYTVDKSFRGGVLYCSISSSVVRNQLFFQRDILVDAINQFLRNDDLFVKDDRRTCYVRSIVLK